MQNFLGIIFISICLSGYSSVIFKHSAPKVHLDSSVGGIWDSVIVNASKHGLMAIWEDPTSNHIVTTISNDLGDSWSSLQTVSSGSLNTFNWLTANHNGILSGISIYNSDPQGRTYYTSLYSKGSWSPLKNIGGTQNNHFIDGSHGVFVTSSENLFLATWSWINSVIPNFVQNVYVNISTDGINWLLEPILVGSTNNEIAFPLFPSACIKDDLILITWIDNTNFEAKVALSSDKGMSWSTPLTVASTGCSKDNSTSVSCFALPQGFLLAYTNDTGLYSIFSADGIHWSTPSLVTSKEMQIVDYLPSISGNSCGFIIAWVGQNPLLGGLDIYVSISDNQGTTWSAPIAVTQDSSVYFREYLSNVSISVYNDQFILGWKNLNNNAVTCHGSLTCIEN